MFSISNKILLSGYGLIFHGSGLITKVILYVNLPENTWFRNIILVYKDYFPYDVVKSFFLYFAAYNFAYNLYIYFSQLLQVLYMKSSSKLNISSKLYFLALCFFVLIQLNLDAMNLNFSMTFSISLFFFGRIMCLNTLTRSSTYAQQNI